MRRKEKKLSFVHTGLPSLLVIFVMLCLVTFAVLSYVSALRDYSLALKTAQRTQLYYETDARLRSRIAVLDQQLSEIYSGLPGDDEAAFLSACGQHFPGLSGSVLTLEEPFGEGQQLCATLLLKLPAKEGGHFYQITGWQTVATADWTPDDRLPVFQGP